MSEEKDSLPEDDFMSDLPEGEASLSENWNEEDFLDLDQPDHLLVAALTAAVETNKLRKKENDNEKAFKEVYETFEFIKKKLKEIEKS